MCVCVLQEHKAVAGAGTIEIGNRNVLGDSGSDSLARTAPGSESVKDNDRVLGNGLLELGDAVVSRYCQFIGSCW